MATGNCPLRCTTRHSQRTAGSGEKKKWHIDNGYRPFDEPSASGSRGVLIWMDDRDGVDQPKWLDTAKRFIESSPARRAVKKTAAKGA